MKDRGERGYPAKTVWQRRGRHDAWTPRQKVYAPLQVCELPDYPYKHHKEFALKEQSSESEGIPGQTWSASVRAENGASGRTDAFTGSSGEAIFIIRGCRSLRGMGNRLGLEVGV